MPEHDSCLYNSRIINTYLHYLRKNYPDLNINDVFGYANIKSYEIADQGHWFTQEQIDRFYERLVQLTGNVNIARDAGRYAASPEAIGIMRQYILGLVGPGKAFEHLKEATRKFTKSARYESRQLAKNKVEVTVKPLPGVEEKSFQCQNRIGFFEAIILGFNCGIPSIEHPECIFNGDESCRYIIRWNEPIALILRRAFQFNMLALIFFFPVIIFYFNFLTASIGTILLLTSFLLLFFSDSLERKEFKNSMEHHYVATENLIKQINVNYNNALIINEIGNAINMKHTLDDILSDVIDTIQKRFDYDRGLILISNDEKTNLSFIAGYGYNQEQLDLLKKTTFHLDRPESKGIFVISFREKKPFLINDIGDIEPSLSPRSLFFAKKLGVHSFICCPITANNEPLGILAVDNLTSKRPLVQSDISLLMSVATVIGIRIKNTDLLNQKSKQFESLLQVLAASTDARDYTTAGHSEKVTEYALGICRELGLPREYCEVVRISSLLHDYGKIAIPDVILKKEGRLSRDEYEIIKTHSEKTRDILQQINFEGILKQVPEIAGAHHERIDGKGYPRGLRGREIPLGAKIIAVADFFEAVTSKRHYREPMQIQEAFKLLREGIGSHFEKKIVEAFITYYESCEPNQDKERDFPPVERKNRIIYRTPVFIRTDSGVFFGSTSNLCVGGLYITSDHKFQKNSLVDVTFSLPEDCLLVVHARGRVAWLNYKTDKKKASLPSGFGLEFVQIKATATEAIQDWVRSVTKSCKEAESFSDQQQLQLDILT